MPLLEYAKWQRFEDVIERAKLSCEVAGFSSADHFSHLPGSVSGFGRFGDDCKLSRYACHLVAMNGDVRKEAIAQAQAYFSFSAAGKELSQADAPSVVLQVQKSIEEAEVLGDWLVGMGIDKTIGKQLKIDMVASQHPHLKGTFEQAKKFIAASDPLESVGMNATQVGEHLNPVKKAKEVNELLEAMGLQYKVERTSTKTGKLKYFWQVTEGGQKYSVVHKVTNTDTDWNGNQIKWQMSVVGLIQERLDDKVA